MDDPGLANGGSPPHGLPRIQTNRSARAQSSGSGMDGLSNGCPTPHEVPRTDNGYMVDDPVEANGGSSSPESPPTAIPGGTGAGDRVDNPEEANEGRPMRGLRRRRRLARENPHRAAPTEYPRLSVTFTWDPENVEGNQNQLRLDLASYELATQALLFVRGLATLHRRALGRLLPMLAMRYAREPDVELSMEFSVSERAPRWERVDQGLLQVRRREVHENLRVTMGGANESSFVDTACYDIRDDPMTPPADPDA